nr:putative quinol monooxygenase [Micromonospora sp. DSM 115978]
MFTVVVTLDVQPDQVDAFLTAIADNARATLREEPGCLRFDVHRRVNDPYQFVLYEIYRDEDAFYHEHRATPHYQVWREAAARMVRPGGHVNTFCTPAFPADIPEGRGDAR